MLTDVRALVSFAICLIMVCETEMFNLETARQLAFLKRCPQLQPNIYIIYINAVKKNFFLYHSNFLFSVYSVWYICCAVFALN